MKKVNIIITFNINLDYLGLLGFFRGSSASMLRESFGNIMYFGVYFKLKVVLGLDDT